MKVMILILTTASMLKLPFDSKGYSVENLTYLKISILKTAKFQQVLALKGLMVLGAHIKTHVFYLTL